jgi:hypothetical protein
MNISTGEFKISTTEIYCPCVAHVLLLTRVNNSEWRIEMNAQAQHETMLRKPILMPPSMIKKVDSIAKRKKVSFAEVVREAVNAFGGKPTSEDEQILDALADTMIQTTKNLVDKINEIEKRLDNTHALMEDK